MWTKKTLIAVSIVTAVCAPATSFAHTNPDLPPASLLAGFLHPLTGLDHIAVLLFVGALLSLTVTTQPRVARYHIGLLTLAGLLSWMTMHYSGAHFFVYASGCLTSSLVLLGAGAAIGHMGQRTRNRVRLENR